MESSVNEGSKTGSIKPMEGSPEAWSVCRISVPASAR